MLQISIKIHYHLWDRLHKIYNDIHFELQVTEQRSCETHTNPGWDLSNCSLYFRVHVAKFLEQVWTGLVSIHF